MNLKNMIRTLIFVAAVLLIISCETGKTTGYDEKLTLFCYAKADSVIDSLYLSRTGGVNEAISFENLGISGAVINLFEKQAENEEYALIGDLTEYPDRKGIYYLLRSDFPGGFQEGYFYKLEVSHADYDDIYSETVCPPELLDITVKNSENDIEIASINEDPSAVDTVYYRRGTGFDDIKLIECRFDSLPVLTEERMASFRIVPDEICRLDTAFWLEDTTKTVWEDYPFETRIFKNKNNYGKETADYYLRTMPVYWYMFYHGGPHTVIFSSTDKAFRQFIESFAGGEERYTNVVNGTGLFSLSNSSSDRSRYRIHVISLEDKYP
ncbi:MAG: DUF4249 family protein [Candidatus Delongbacteria bacterium]|nr:DUF4249 family protein [Candidatus Delongbacteria bacterium]